MADFSSIPPDLVVNILAHLGTTQEVIKCSYLSHELQDITNTPRLWQELATIKYGENIATETIQFYQGDWKEMIKDDNQKGALPTLLLFQPCLWKYNDRPRVQRRRYGRRDLFYCCILTAIQWDRVNGRVRVWLDARGNEDLRQPRSSSIRIRSNDGSSQATFRPIGGDFSIEQDGHYKGYLEFPASAFSQEGGTYMFCYANMFHSRADYESIALVQGKLDINMFDQYCLRDENLFQDETHEMEMARWMKVLPQGFLDKRPEWWV